MSIRHVNGFRRRQIRRFIKGENADGTLEYKAVDVINYLLGRFKEEYTVRTHLALLLRWIGCVFPHGAAWLLAMLPMPVGDGLTPCATGGAQPLPECRQG